jgi:hypothetical protein
MPEPLTDKSAGILLSMFQDIYRQELAFDRIEQCGTVLCSLGEFPLNVVVRMDFHAAIEPGACGRFGVAFRPTISSRAAALASAPSGG